MFFSLICESVENTHLLIFYNFVTILLLGILHLYTRYLCLLIRDVFRYSVFRAWGGVGYLIGNVGNLFFMCCWFDTLPPTHTTHTYTHIFGASFSVALGVVTSADVCVCSCRGRSQTIRHVCSLCASHFSISSFEVANHWVYRMYSSHSTAKKHNASLICFRRYTPPKHSNNVILVLSYVYCHYPCVICPT